MTLTDVQNYFYNHKAIEVLCLEGKYNIFIDWNNAYSWTQQSRNMGMDYEELVFSNEGACVANLTKGTLATILNSDSMSGLAGGAGSFIEPHNIIYDGTGISINTPDGQCNHIDLTDLVNSNPNVVSIQDSMTTMATISNHQQEELEELRKMLKDLQPKEKKLTFVKQNIYNLK